MRMRFQHRLSDAGSASLKTVAPVALTSARRGCSEGGGDDIGTCSRPTQDEARAARAVGRLNRFNYAIYVACYQQDRWKVLRMA
jgi:hypothetical protein